MKEKIDFLIVPKYTFTNYESNETVSGKLVCTQKYIFMLDENCSLDDDLKFDNLVNNIEIIGIVDFEWGFIDFVPEKFVLKFEDMEAFHVNLGLFDGGISYKLKGKGSVSFDIAKRSVRKEVKEFYANVNI